MIETSLNVNDYPTAPEFNVKAVKGKVILTYDIDAEVPENWDNEDIINDIKENLNDYINDYDDIEIEI